MREALSGLEHEGLVSIEPRRGTFVVGVTDADIHDIYEIRRMIETYALRLVAKTLDVDGRECLQTQIDEMNVTIRRSQRHLIANPDVRFHRQLVVVAHSPPTFASRDSIGGLISTILSITNNLQPDIGQTVEAHQLMVDTLVARDASYAAEFLRAHLASGEEVVLGALRQVKEDRTSRRSDGNRA